jgi:hypothetical protein
MFVKKLAIGTAVAAMFLFGAGSAALAADVIPTSGDCTISLDENGNKVEDCSQVDPAVTDGSTGGSTDGSAGDGVVPVDVAPVDLGQFCTVSTDADGNETTVCPRVMYDKAGGVNPIAYNFRSTTGTEDPTPLPTPELLDAPIVCGDAGSTATDPSSEEMTDPAVGCVNPTMYKDASGDASCSTTTDGDGNSQTVCPDAMMYSNVLAGGIDGKNIYDSGVFGGSAAAVIIAVVASTVLLRKRNA